MNKSVIGFIITWIFVVIIVVLTKIEFISYIDISSFFIVICGTLLVIFFQFDIKDLIKVKSSFKIAFKESKPEELVELIEKLLFYSREIKKHGLINVNEKVSYEKNLFLKEAFQLLMKDPKIEVLRLLLELKIEHINKKHLLIQDIYSNISSIAGAIGMIVTLILLIEVFVDLTELNSIGPLIASALLPTLYGALIGLLIGIVENKLIQKHNAEIIVCEIIIEAVVMIASDESIEDIKTKLNMALMEH